MYKHYSVVAVWSTLSACGVTLEAADPSDTALAEAHTATGGVVVPVRTVELSDREDDPQRNCENLTRPGSRIVVAQRCRPIDEDGLADQLGQVRREQDELDRLAREREAQRRGF